MNEKIFRFHNESRAVGGINWRIGILNDTFLLHTHDYYEVEYASEGHGITRINGVEYPISAGSIWVLGPNDDHMLEGNNVKVHHMGIYLPDVPRDVASLLEDASFPLAGKIEDPAERKAFESYFSLFADAPPHPVYRERQYHAAATLILIHCFSHADRAKTASNKTVNYVRHAIRYINDHLKEPLTLSAVANELHIVPCYLSGIFAEYAGCPFYEYVTRNRLRHARVLLLRTDKSVTDVAGECGFGCVSAMNRAFQKYLGTSPSQLRKTAREAQSEP